MRTVASALMIVALSSARTGYAQALPKWTFARGAQDSLSALWARSVAGRREEVACLGGLIDSDTVRIDRALPLPIPDSDSLSADAQESLAACGSPDWLGAAHTHIRSTDDPSPAPRFSPADRVVMSLWSNRWGRAGGFCVLYSEKAAHCEVYPPARGPR